MRLSLLSLSLLAYIAAAADLIGRIEPGHEPALAGQFRLRTDTQLLLDGGLSGRALTKRDGSFSFRNLPAADYVLSVSSKDYLFPEYLVTVSAADANILIRPHKSSYLPSTSAPHIPHPLTIRPIGIPAYVEEKQAFNIMAMIRGNPMILMMVFGGAMMFGLPMLMSMVDPEAMAEMKHNQAQMHKSLGSIQQGDLSGFSKLLNPDQMPAAKKEQ